MFEVVGDIEGQLQKIVISDMLKRFNLAINRLAKRARGLFASQLTALISEDDAARSLVEGKLRAQLGLDRSVGASPETAIRDIARGVVNSMQIELFPARELGDGVEAGLLINILKRDFREVLSLPSASFLSEKGERVDWLDWLLTRGDAIILVNRRFFAGGLDSSRTGLGIMAKGRFWKMPSEFSGTVSDNFLTRALSKFPPLAEQIILRELTASLGGP